MTGSTRKILYIDHAPVLGGAQIVLVRMLRSLDRSRWEPLLATPQGSALTHVLAPEDAEICCVPMGRLNRAFAAMPIRLCQAASAIVRLVKTRGISVMHTNTVRSHIVGALASLLSGVPVLWTLHDHTFPAYLVRLLASVPAKVIAVSDWLFDYYASRGLAGKMVVIPNGMDTHAPPRAPGVLRDELGVPHGAPLVLWAGRLIAEKAPHLFVRAACKVIETLPQACFVIVGGAMEHASGVSSSPCKELAEAVSDCGTLKGRLILTGHRADLDRFYAAADLFVYSAVSPEGLPTVLLEAMAYARPVVASFVGGALEIVQDGRTGLLVPPGDAAALAEAMSSLLVDPEKARDFGLAGRTHLEKTFDLRTQVKKVQGIYTEILR